MYLAYIGVFYIHAQPLSCVGLFAIPQTVVCQAPLSMGFSRQEYWSGQPRFPYRCLFSISHSFSIRDEVENKLISFLVTRQLSQYQLFHGQFSSTGSPYQLYFILNYFMHLSLFLDLMSASLICWVFFIPCTSSDLITVACGFIVHFDILYFTLQICNLTLPGTRILCCVTLGRLSVVEMGQQHIVNLLEYHASLSQSCYFLFHLTFVISEIEQ